MDVGTSGLDLAYEVMRGYDALILLDATRQGGEPGTLYVMEPDRAEFEGGDQGRRVDRPPRHEPAHDAALRDRHGGWPGRVLVIGCEPGEAEPRARA